MIIFPFMYCMESSKASIIRDSRVLKATQSESLMSGDLNKLASQHSVLHCLGYTLSLGANQHVFKGLGKVV